MRRLEAARALIEAGADPHDASARAGLAIPLYGDEIRRAIDVAIRVHDTPIGIVGELVDVYTLRFALEALAWRPLRLAPDGDWHVRDAAQPWLARITATSPDGQAWEFVIDTSELEEQVLSVRRVESA